MTAGHEAFPQHRRLDGVVALARASLAPMAVTGSVWPRRIRDDSDLPLGMRARLLKHAQPPIARRRRDGAVAWP